MFVLITTFYCEKDLKRRNEMLKAIRGNINNSLITKIYIICESGEKLLLDLDEKVEIIKLQQRPKFQELIKFSNSLTKNFIKIIANTDIYFDETLIKAKHIKENNVFCLTRWDLKETKEIEFYPNFKSQDSWIFKNILPEDIGDYFMGLPGCDNRLAGELYEHKIKITNPSLSIRSLHIHNTQKRNYNKISDRVTGNFAYTLPDTLSGDVYSGNTVKMYLLVRRKYYSAIMENRLKGNNIGLFHQFVAPLLFYYYKVRLKLN
jgi:hypothetical protein